MADQYEISRAPTIVNELIQQSLKPDTELIKSIYQRIYNSRISNSGVYNIRNLYYKKYATPTTVTGVDMYDGPPVTAIPLRDNEILEPIGSYAPGKSDKKLGYFKKMFGISSKPKATLVETETVGGTRRRRRRSKKTRKMRRRSRRHR